MLSLTADQKSSKKKSRQNGITPAEVSSTKKRYFELGQQAVYIYPNE